MTDTDEQIAEARRRAYLRAKRQLLEEEEQDDVEDVT